MEKVYIYTLDTALQAHENGQLFQWAQNYLRGEGQNEGLADHLTNRNPGIIELRKFPLGKLERIIGPEKNMRWVETSEVWEKRVNSLVERIKEGKKMPPLIVTDFWKPLQLSDGSHRQEAFIRCGIREYWTIFFFNKEESRKLLSESQ